MPTLDSLAALTILRLAGVLATSGQARSTLYLRVAQGLYTKPIHLAGSRSVGWPLSEVTSLNAARIAGQTDDEIRCLVKQLEAARKTAPAIVVEMCAVMSEPEMASKPHDSADAEDQTLIVAPMKARKSAA